MKNQKYTEEWKSKKLSNFIRILIIIICVMCIFGYAGYHFGKENNYDIKKCIIFGSLYPFAIGILIALDMGGFFSYIIFTIFYIFIINYIPLYVGMFIFAIIIFSLFVEFMKICSIDTSEDEEIIETTKKYDNYTLKKEEPINDYEKYKLNDEVITHEELEDEYSHTNYDEIEDFEENELSVSNDFEVQYDIHLYDSHYDEYEESKLYNEIENILPEEEYYCQRCDKKISEEEYMEYAGLCEECDAEVYFEPRYDGDDYDLYK